MFGTHMMQTSFYLFLTVVNLVFNSLEALGESHAPNSYSGDHEKRINEVLNFVQPDVDNSLVYLDLHDVIYKYLLPSMEAMTSDEDIEYELYNLFRRGNMSQVRRCVKTVFDAKDEREILNLIPSALQQRAEKIFFNRVNSSERGNWKKNIKGIIDVMCVNKHNIQFAIKAKCGVHGEEKLSAKQLAAEGIIEMLLWCDLALDKTAAEQWEKWKIVSPRETVYLSVAVVKGELTMGFYNSHTEYEPSYVSS